MYKISTPHDFVFLNVVKITRVRSRPDNLSILEEGLVRDQS